MRRSGLSSKLLPDNHLVIVDEISELAVTLNPTAAVIWEFCDGEHSSVEMSEELTLLSVGHEVISLNEINALLEELSQLGLLESL